ncbi:MAG: hypothetical protein ACSNEK_02640 [Parachlamydiaceae bacterium]
MVKKAKESAKIQRAREKLKQKIRDEKRNFTPGSLKNISLRLRKEIKKHHPENDSLKDRNISLATVKSPFILKMKKLLESQNTL